MRNLSPEMISEFTGSHTAPVLMCELYLDSITLGFWTGYGDLVWGDKNFTGAGTFINISSIDETQDNAANGVVASLNGIPSNIIAVALSERVRGRKFRMYIGVVSTTRAVATEDDGVVLTEDGGLVLLENQLIDEPYRFFSGLMDVMEFSDDGETANINLSVENELIIGQRNKIERYTPEYQKKLYPSDKGLDLINQLQDKEIVW